MAERVLNGNGSSEMRDQATPLQDRTLEYRSGVSYLRAVITASCKARRMAAAVLSSGDSQIPNARVDRRRDPEFARSPETAHLRVPLKECARTVERGLCSSPAPSVR